ncbi:hypothetical protein AVEN_40764-1, partial [Araneus ventricosus]
MQRRSKLGSSVAAGRSSYLKCRSTFKKQNFAADSARISNNP